MSKKTFLTNMINIKLLVLLSTITGVITACNSLVGFQQDDSVSSKLLSFPPADYSSILWIDNEMIAWTNTLTADNTRSYAKLNDQNFRQIKFPDDPNCEFSTDYYVYETLPNGHLQLWKLCRVGTKSLPTKTLTYLLTYNWQTGRIEGLAGPLPLGSSQVSWNPDQTKGIVYLDSKFSSQTLFWIWNGGFGSLDLVITDQGKSWNLKNFSRISLNLKSFKAGIRDERSGRQTEAQLPFLRLAMQ